MKLSLFATTVITIVTLFLLGIGSCCIIGMLTKPAPTINHDWTASHRPAWVSAKVNDETVALIEKAFREGRFIKISPGTYPANSRLWFNKSTWGALMDKEKKSILTAVSGVVHVGGFSPDLEVWTDGEKLPVASGSYLTKFDIR